MYKSKRKNHNEDLKEIKGKLLNANKKSRNLSKKIIEEELRDWDS